MIIFSLHKRIGSRVFFMFDFNPRRWMIGIEIPVSCPPQVEVVFGPLIFTLLVMEKDWNDT